MNECPERQMEVRAGVEKHLGLQCVKLMAWKSPGVSEGDFNKDS